MPENIAYYLAFVELFVYHRFFSVTVDQRSPFYL